jgi:hypothetical protein
MTLSLISFLVGAALGQRFKVVVLLPASAMALLIAVRTGVTQAQTVWTIILLAAAAATCLQIGYFVGIYFHHVLTAAFPGRPSPSPAPRLRHGIPHIKCTEAD